MFELFDHTADLGLRARAGSPDDLFIEMAYALRAALLENPESVEAREQYTVRIEGNDRDYLLCDWLDHILKRAEMDRFLLARCSVTVSADALSAEVWGEPVDESRHQLSHEVKAVTYHGLRIEREPEGTWLGEVIVDI